jgi:hypothetical protein
MTGTREWVRVFAAAITVGLTLGPERLAAQQRMPAVGDRVRVSWTTPPGVTLQGDLTALRGDTLFVRGDLAARAVPVPFAQVERIEVRQRRPRLQGMGLGALIGAPIGLAGGYLLGASAEPAADDCADDCGLLKTVGAAAGLVSGTVLGALIGVSTPGGRWVAVERPATRVAVSVSVGLR